MKNLFKGTSLSDKIQFIIMTIICLTLIVSVINSWYTRESIKQQFSFSKNAQRPWVIYKPFNALGFLPEDSTLHTYVRLKNIGNSPAFSITIKGIFSHSSEYCDSLIKQIPNIRTEPFLFHLDDSLLASKEAKLDLRVHSGKPINLALRDQLVSNPVYFHSYLEYFDAESSKYCFKNTYRADVTSENILEAEVTGKKGVAIQVIWVPFYSSPKCMGE